MEGEHKGAPLMEGMLRGVILRWQQQKFQSCQLRFGAVQSIRAVTMVVTHQHPRAIDLLLSLSNDQHGPKLTYQKSQAMHRSGAVQSIRAVTMVVTHRQPRAIDLLLSLSNGQQGPKLI